jgi:hypothetical protein
VLVLYPVAGLPGAAGPLMARTGGAGFRFLAGLSDNPVNALPW